MAFLRDLIRWFLFGERRKNVSVSQPVSVDVTLPVVQVPEPVKKEPSTFDFLKSNDPKEFLGELKSIRPFADQFDIAREDLLRELQRLAPPKKRIFDIFNKAA